MSIISTQNLTNLRSAMLSLLWIVNSVNTGEFVAMGRCENLTVGGLDAQRQGDPSPIWTMTA
jgi:hypothetical protein